jgi:outer membrane protein assembly factor BamB
MALLFSAIVLTQLANMGRARARLSRRYLFLVAVGLIFAMVVSLVVMAKFGFLEPSVPIDSSPAFTGIPLQRPLEYPATALAVDNGKVFVTVSDFRVGGGYPLSINCFDSQSGKSLWNSSALSQLWARVLVASEGRVYFGFGSLESQIGCLNATTGELLWTQQGSIYELTLKDGQGYTSEGSFNVTTGEFLWQTTYNRIWSNTTAWQDREVQGFPLNGKAYDGRYLYGAGGDFSSMHFFKLDTYNGNVLWSSNFAYGILLTFVDPHLTLPNVWAINPQQVIIFKGSISSPSFYEPPKLFSLDPNTGKQLWTSPISPELVNISVKSSMIHNNLVLLSASDGYLYALNLFDGTLAWRIKVDATIYNPTVYDDSLLFATSNGYFYSVNLANGAIAWKTKVDTQNLFSLWDDPNSSPQPTLLFDTGNQRVFWSFALKTGDSLGNYTGTLCSIDLTTGNMKWTNLMKGEWLQPLAGLALNNDKIFLTGNNALWIYAASTGDLVDSQQFDGSVLAPVVLGNTTFVAAGLKLFAYV